jgi:putative endonuclease
MYYIYILKSVELDKFYIGYSSDPWRRLTEHLENTKEKYTGKAKDWILQGVFEVSEIALSWFIHFSKA